MQRGKKSEEAGALVAVLFPGWIPGRSSGDIGRSRNCRKARDYMGRHSQPQALNTPSPLQASWGEPPLTSAPSIVLDTNVVLDWLLFADPGLEPIAAAIVAGRLRWCTCTSMRDEIAHVLARGLAARHHADPATLLERWDAHVAPPEAAPPTQPLICSDPDDQKFIDLALAIGARWLVSRDRALLKLARHAARQGLAIVTPRQWPHGSERVT